LFLKFTFDIRSGNDKHLFAVSWLLNAGGKGIYDVLSSSLPPLSSSLGKLPWRYTQLSKLALTALPREIYTSYSQVRDCSFDFQAGNLPTGGIAPARLFPFERRSLLLTILADGTETEVGMVATKA